MWLCATSELLLAASQLPTKYSPHAAPRYRADIVSALGDKICQSSEPIELHQLWSLGVFDLHLNIQRIKAKKNFKIDSKQLAKAARNEALKHGSGGFAYKQCNPNTAWIVHLVSPAKVVRMKHSRLEIDGITLNKNCRSFRLDYAQLFTPKTKLIFTSKNNQYAKRIDINTGLLSEGTIGLTCYPYDRKKGPVEWTMIPIHDADKVFHSVAKNFFNHSVSGIEGFKHWINKQRTSVGLTALNFKHPYLAKAAKQLTVNHPKVTHYRPALATIKNYLASKKLNFLGENRVIADNPNEYARLFWLSPRHRSLLLSPSARYAAIYPLKKGRQTLIVLILAAEMPIQKNLSRSL